MESTASALRTLIQVKHRRVDQLDTALQACCQKLRQQQAAFDEACAEETARRGEEAGLRDGLLTSTTPTGGLRGSDIMARQLYLDVAVQRAAVATKAVLQARQQAEAAQQQVGTARQALQRGQHKLEHSRERLSAALLELAQADEDTQDEEAEEMAVARLLANTRQQLADAEHVMGHGA